MADLEERRKQSFVFASDTVKQLTTLSTGIVTLTVTFQKDVIKSEDDFTKDLLLWAWIAFLVSIVCGVAGMMGLTGELSGSSDPPSINNSRVRLFPMVQALAFLVGIALIIWFGRRAI